MTDMVIYDRISFTRKYERFIPPRRQAAVMLAEAAALAWCENEPLQRVFLTSDPRLREAATLSGFDAEQI
jgi:hypothetical protein